MTLDIQASLLILGGAALLDFTVGDPVHFPHPVQAMGSLIQKYCRLTWHYLKGSQQQQIAGMGLAILLMGGSAGISWLLMIVLWRLNTVLAILGAIALVASGFAGRSLRDAAMDVLQHLTTGDLDQARRQLRRYVGRDTERLSEAEILRAVLETVTENAIDGVLAPLFYALLGAALPGVGSLPTLMAYKAASTLDSMVGYREPPYRDIGWLSAKTEDCLTWLPCRLAVLTIAIISGQPRYVLRICARDAPADPSPNAGWSECAYAATLGVQVGGDNYYQGKLKQKPLLGDARVAITVDSIHRAIGITRTCFLLWLAIGLIIISVLRISIL